MLAVIAFVNDNSNSNSLFAIVVRLALPCWRHDFTIVLVLTAISVIYQYTKSQMIYTERHCNSLEKN